MQRQVNRPFLKRYLKRDDILRAIQGCDAQLNDALNTFNVRLPSVFWFGPDNRFFGTAFHPDSHLTPDP
jgi:hypothetical protein